MMVDKNLGQGGGVLEITLDAGPDADEAGLPPQHIDLEYVQTTIKGITRSFVMFDDIYINHSQRVVNPKAFALKFFRYRDKAQQRVNMTYLDARPERQIHIAWDWFFNGLAAVAWAFVIIYVGEYTDYSISHDFMLPVGILLGTFGIIAFLVFYYKTQDRVVYKSYIGQLPVFDLFHMPRNKAYNNYIDVLEAGINKAQHRDRMSMKYRLVGELKLLRRMKEAGSISIADYEAARSKIFKHKEYTV